MTREERLIRKYKRAQQEIADIIVETEAEGSEAEYQEKLMVAIMATLAALYADTEAWTGTNIRDIYKNSLSGVISDVANQYKKAGKTPLVSVGWRSVDESTVGIISDNLNADLTNAIEYVGRGAQDSIRRAGLEASFQGVTLGQTAQQAKQNLITMLQDQGLAFIPTSDGRHISLDAYAEMTIRSNAHSAANMATINYADGIGRDLIRISEHFGSCPICAPYQGRVYSKSGADTRFPYLYDTPWSQAYQNFHPNCRHFLSVYIEELQTPEEVEQAMQYSNRSYEPGRDGWTQEQVENYKRSIEAYNKGQAVKVGIYRDRKQYFRYQAALGEDAPKSFAGFRRMKNADSDAWHELMTNYREAMRKLRTG